jgi:hypothetical protein
MERSASVQQIGRLGFCKQTAPRSEADLGQAILRKYIRPVAQRVGIQKRFGWHTFRHTYATLLRSVGTEFKVMQELLRHSSFRFYVGRLHAGNFARKARCAGRSLSGTADWKRLLIDEQGCKQGSKTCLLHPFWFQ